MVGDAQEDERPNSCTFYVRVTVRPRNDDDTISVPFGRRGEVDRRTRFWAQVERVARSVSGITPDQGESIIETALPSRLTRSFSSRRRRISEYNTTAALDAEAEYAFKVRVVDYGSALLSITATGVNDLAQLLDKNFDLFIALTETYVASGFQETFMLPEGSIIANASGFESARANFVGAGARGGSSSAGDAKPDSRLNYIRGLIQGTLILPVLLALLVCYVAMNAWDHERDRQRGEGDRLSSERIAVLDFAKSHILSLVQQNTDLSKALAQNGASEVIAIVQQNTALMKETIAPRCCCIRCCAVPTPPAPKPKPKPTVTPQCK
ncbi:hypothetical protein [Paraburkholderia saeva]|uniref:Uncharacterized protein n=1 Tax=Paraburkholderia saeva TaxID=2777537 RepID=A0A9N8X4B8_9BURK|nr:hypothetical protein [Paraburkholderia saeva]CAG4919175.1 hypothetical protein LMG31841_04851 [Paraburkholderia saeva]